MLPGATADCLVALRRTHTLAATAAQLNAEGPTTVAGSTWTVGTVANVHKRLTEMPTCTSA